MDNSEPKIGRRKGKDKARDTFEKYGKNTQKGARAKEKIMENNTVVNNADPKKKEKVDK